MPFVILPRNVGVVYGGVCVAPSRVFHKKMRVVVLLLLGSVVHRRSFRFSSFPSSTGLRVGLLSQRILCVEPALSPDDGHTV